MMKYITFILLWTLYSPIIAQKKEVKGSGYVLTQERKTPYFNSIEVSDQISVYIVQGEFAPITVEADNNLFPYIKTEVQNKVLKIYIPDSINIVKFTFMSILISLPKIESLCAQQHSLINVSPEKWQLENVILFASSGSKIHLEAQTFNLNIFAKTASTIELKGKSNHVNATLNSASKLYGRNFEVQKIEINLNNNSKAEINALCQLKYNIKGKSKLFYKGDPKVIDSYVDANSKIGHSEF